MHLKMTYINHAKKLIKKKAKPLNSDAFSGVK